MDTLILNAIVKYNETNAGGANLIDLERKFPEMNKDEISEVIERLIDDGEVIKKNYLYYPGTKSN